MDKKIKAFVILCSLGICIGLLSDEASILSQRSDREQVVDSLCTNNTVSNTLCYNCTTKVLCVELMGEIVGYTELCGEDTVCENDATTGNAVCVSIFSIEAHDVNYGICSCVLLPTTTEDPIVPGSDNTAQDPYYPCSFVKCVDNHPLHFDCGDECYSPELDGCAPGTPVSNVTTPDCAVLGPGTFPHPDNCAWYYICNSASGNAIVGECENPSEVYDDVQGNCIIPPACNPCEGTTENVVTDNFDCRKHVICNGGVIIDESCCGFDEYADANGMCSKLDGTNPECPLVGDCAVEAANCEQ